MVMNDYSLNRVDALAAKLRQQTNQDLSLLADRAQVWASEDRRQRTGSRLTRVAAGSTCSQWTAALHLLRHLP